MTWHGGNSLFAKPSVKFPNSRYAFFVTPTSFNPHRSLPSPLFTLQMAEAVHNGEEPLSCWGLENQHWLHGVLGQSRGHLWWGDIPTFCYLKQRIWMENAGRTELLLMLKQFRFLFFYPSSCWRRTCTHWQPSSKVSWWNRYTSLLLEGKHFLSSSTNHPDHEFTSDFVEFEDDDNIKVRLVWLISCRPALYTLTIL